MNFFGKVDPNLLSRKVRAHAKKHKENVFPYFKKKENEKSFLNYFDHFNIKIQR